MARILEINGSRWRVLALPEEARRSEDERWHYARVRFEPVEEDEEEFPPRETWLRLEEDMSADVLDQYEDEALAEAFLISEEVGG